MKRIKHYKILDQLGRGGMGEVYKAFDTNLEREVAIKVMHPHLLDDEVIDQRFQREARAAAKLSHPNIVTIYEIGKTKAGRYIVMEYVDGHPLTQFLKPKYPLQVETAIKFMTQVLQGLFCAHNFGILHRDIKPDNILVSENHVAKILDFGIAKIASKEGLTVAGDILGTVEHMAPEQMLGETVDFKCDIYSAGVVMYQLLTKRLPFTGETPVAILYKILNEEPVPPSYYNNQVSQKLDQVVLKAIDKSKEDRWQTAGEFSEALDSILRIESLEALQIEVENESHQFEDLGEARAANENNTGEAGFRPTFIGRDQEFKKLVNIFSRASRGQGQTMLLMGEAGVGKSTLANQLKSYAQQNQAWVLYGACLYQEGMDAYLPYIDALRGFFNRENHVLADKERTQLKKMIKEKVPILEEFSERFATGFGVPDSKNNGNSRPENIFDAVYQLISLLANIKPVVFIIDDLHWADEASLRLFHYLSHHVSKNRVLLLGICRTDRYDLQKNGQPTAVVDVLARIRREGTCEQIVVSRLGKEASDNLIDKVLQPTLFTDEFYQLVHEETKGNPLFLLETLKLLRENDTIFFKEGSWMNKQEGLDIHVPSKVEDVFIRRLSVLNEDEREILQFAAVAGYEFDSSLVSRLLEITRLKLLKSLQRVERDLQILASTDSGYKFEHPLLRDLLYKEIPKGLRCEYHLMIAEELEKAHRGDYGAMIGDMAQHLRRGGKHDRAAKLLWQAAERSYKLAAYREASLYIEDFLDSEEKSGETQLASEDRQTLYLKLARSYEESGRWRESLKSYERLLGMSDENGDLTGQLDALQRMGRINEKLGDSEGALAVFQTCLQRVQENQIEDRLPDLFNSLGILHYKRGDLDLAQHFFQETIDSCESENDEKFKANALINLGIIANIRSDYDEAISSYEQALQIYQGKEDQKNQARIYHNLGLTYFDMKKWDEAIEMFEQSAALTEQFEDKQLRGLIHLNLGKVYAEKADISQAKKYTEKALKTFKIVGDILSIAEAYHVFGIIHCAAQNFSEAELFLNESITLNEQQDYQEGLAETYITYARLSERKGDIKASLDHYEKARKIFETLNLNFKSETVTGSVTQVLHKQKEYSEEKNEFVS